MQYLNNSTFPQDVNPISVGAIRLNTHIGRIIQDVSCSLYNSTGGKLYFLTTVHFHVEERWAEVPKKQWSLFLEVEIKHIFGERSVTSF